MLNLTKIVGARLESDPTNVTIAHDLYQLSAELMKTDLDNALIWLRKLIRHCEHVIPTIAGADLACAKKFVDLHKGALLAAAPYDFDSYLLNPDYERIKGNIEYLIALSKTMYADYSAPALETANITGYPRVSFFNNVVNATKAMLENCYSPSGTRSMRLYASNGVGWTASELNAIENNHLLLYRAFSGQKSGIPRLEMTLGGRNIGS